MSATIFPASRLHELRRQRLGPAAAAAVDYFRSLRMRPDPTFQFVLSTGQDADKPRVFQTLADLCRAIHRLRGGAPLHLMTEKMVFEPGASLRVIGVYTLDEGGVPARFLGHAYLAGQKWTVLREALYAADPDPSPRVEAA